MPPFAMDDALGCVVNALFCDHEDTRRHFLPMLVILAANCFAGGKATKLSSEWTGRNEAVHRIPFLRTVVVIRGYEWRLGTTAPVIAGQQ